MKITLERKETLLKGLLILKLSPKNERRRHGIDSADLVRIIFAAEGFEGSLEELKKDDTPS